VFCDYKILNGISKMSKAKVASKNNPVSRGQAREYFHQGKKIKPVKLIEDGRAFLSAEYDESGDLVVNSAGKALTWSQAKM
jgi:hypothetical protein